MYSSYFEKYLFLFSPPKWRLEVGKKDNTEFWEVGKATRYLHRDREGQG
jgi:hypothetical protein